MIKKKVGDYLIISSLGKGQFGHVYKAQALNENNKIYALKCVEKDKLNSKIIKELFQTEISIMSEINHPNILHLYEFMETKNNYYLVITYCNNGDLEAYLKNTGRLSESEAIYFLMQIMNGFRELHKHKIMHRDVKLANIFLNDNTVVIGDFGFAKKGQCIAFTLLGTPITMAPELLNSSGEGYSNKSDLWSIGICFYEMLFGDIPFNAKDYADLKIKIKSQSGKNLKFPKDVPISDECKDLLISLLEYDMKKRIEWNDFFNHKLFSFYENNKSTEMSKSMIMTQYEKRVKDEFTKNQKLAENTNLNDPTKLFKQQIKYSKVSEETIDKNKSLEIDEIIKMEGYYNVIQKRYQHQKSIILFIMVTVRKIRNLFKMNKYFNSELGNKLMYTTCILLKKGLIMNMEVIKSLEENRNLFNLNGFEGFLKLNKHQNILMAFEKDNSIYQKFFEQMIFRLKTEIKDVKILEEWEIINKLNYSNMDLLNKKLSNYFKYFCIEAKQISPNIEDEYCLAILNFYYSIFTEQEFSFVVNNSYFDWKNFETHNCKENAKVKLEKLC
jgi:serine/threonine protein kinase